MCDEILLVLFLLCHPKQSGPWVTDVSFHVQQDFFFFFWPKDFIISNMWFHGILNILYIVVLYEGKARFHVTL